MNFAATISAVVASCCEEEPDLHGEFVRHGLKQWQSFDVDIDAPPHEMLVDFIVYLLEDDKGDPVYFGGPFEVAAMLAYDEKPQIALKGGYSGFATAVRKLRDTPSATIDDWFVMLSDEIGAAA